MVAAILRAMWPDLPMPRRSGGPGIEDQFDGAGKIAVQALLQGLDRGRLMLRSGDPVPERVPGKR